MPANAEGGGAYSTGTKGILNMGAVPSLGCKIQIIPTETEFMTL